MGGESEEDSGGSQATHKIREQKNKRINGREIPAEE